MKFPYPVTLPGLHSGTATVHGLNFDNRMTPWEMAVPRCGIEETGADGGRRVEMPLLQSAVPEFHCAVVVWFHLSGDTALLDYPTPCLGMHQGVYILIGWVVFKVVLTRFGILLCIVCFQ